MLAGERNETLDNNQDRATSDKVVKKRRGRGPTRPEKRKAPNPIYPEKVNTREDLSVALMYYERERLATTINDAKRIPLSEEEQNKMPRPDVLLYQHIYAKREAASGTRDAENEEAEDSLTPENSEDEYMRTVNNLRTKTSSIRLGRAFGSTWTSQDMKKLEELDGRPHFRDLENNFNEIKPFVEHCWNIDRKMLSKLDQHPWKVDPISYIHELLSRNPPSRAVTLPSSPHPVHQ